jgi:mono/diheme cytochrome c family protein
LTKIKSPLAPLLYGFVVSPKYGTGAEATSSAHPASSTLAVRRAHVAHGDPLVRLAATIAAPVFGAVIAVAACTPRSPPAPPPASEAALPSDQATIAQGRSVARDWCARCHIVSPEQVRVANPAAGAPRFADVAQRWSARPSELRRFLDELHLPMPTFRLWPQERDAVAAYLVSLDTSHRE